MIKINALMTNFFFFFGRIDFNMIIKISDFGLSVNIGDKDYYRLTKHVDVKLPLKWMAPESLIDFMFSELTDVVSGLEHKISRVQ